MDYVLFERMIPCIHSKPQQSEYLLDPKQIPNNTHIHYRHVNKISYNTDFGKWREESMANAIALRIIKDFGDIRFFDYAIKFMWSQPAEYALGVLMEDFNWRDMRSVMDNKYKGVDQTLQDQWLDYVKGNPDWQGLKKWNERLGG